MVSLRTSVKMETSSKLDCLLCNKKFSFELHLWQHQYLVHFDDAVSATKEYVCVFCSFVGEKPDSLRCHLFEAHVSPHACPSCPRRFSSFKKMATHVERKHAKGRYDCVLCNKVLCNAKALANHVDSIHRFLPRKQRCTAHTEDACRCGLYKLKQEQKMKAMASSVSTRSFHPVDVNHENMPSV